MGLGWDHGIQPAHSCMAERERSRSFIPHGIVSLDRATYHTHTMLTGQHSGFYTPAVYNGTTYQVLKGTSVSGDNFKFTALCTGCTTWTDYDGNQQTLDLTQPARLAFALSHTPVSTPSDSNSSFDIHDYVGHWYADLAAAKSSEFDSWVQKNTVATGNGTVYRHSQQRRLM